MLMLLQLTSMLMLLHLMLMLLQLTSMLMLLQLTLNVRSRGKKFCFPESPDVGKIRTRGKAKLTGFQRDLALSVLLIISRLSLQHTSTATKEYASPERIKTVDSLLISPHGMIYKVLSLYYLHLFPPLAAVSLLG